MKIDPYKHKERYLRWKAKVLHEGIIGISKENSDVILRYIFDMENGLNVSNDVAKGARSPIRLNNLVQRVAFLAKELEARNSIRCLTDLTEDQLLTFFSNMRKGEIRRKDGKVYESVGDFARIFKAFWHWWIKVNKKFGDYYLLPGGGWEHEESIEECVVREVKEETGLDVEVDNLAYYKSFYTDDDDTLDLIFKCKIIGGDLENNDPDGKVKSIELISSEDELTRLNFHPKQLKNRVFKEKNSTRAESLGKAKFPEN